MLLVPANIFFRAAIVSSWNESLTYVVGRVSKIENIWKYNHSLKEKKL